MRYFAVSGATMISGTSPGTRFGSRWVMLGLLFCAYALSGADRQLVAVLAEPIRKDLGLSDSQLGMLSGLAFALFYTVFAIPIAWLADRTNRIATIAFSCLVWSLSTAGCGIAGNYLQLALWRVGVATGEAGASPSAHSLISENFPPERRGMALALYSIGLPVGIAAGTAYGGWIGSLYGWRSAFLWISVPGIVLSLLLLLLVRTAHNAPELKGSAAHKAPPPLPLRETLRGFCKNPVLWQTTFAGSMAALSSYALMVWIPAFLMREKGMSLADIARSYSVLSGSAMVVGMIAGGLLVDRWQRRDPRASAMIPALAYLAAAPLVLMAIWANDWRVCLALLAVPLALMMTWLPPALATVQNAADPRQRSVVSAIFMLVTGIIGNGAGPLVVGLLSDAFAPIAPGRSLHWALTAMCPVLLVVSMSYFGLQRTLMRGYGGETRTAGA
ncbi:MFS transporter [Sphingobium sp.]|uniref:spinster family MFS transporter n=1 Tax=Sphingobium sp. TaxID=1912891 RepID=UPI0028BE2423|nr:MFS transporter [Sphingobium sp.]